MPKIKDRKLLLVHAILPDLTPRQAKLVLMHGTSWPLADEATVRAELEALRHCPQCHKPSLKRGTYNGNEHLDCCLCGVHLEEGRDYWLDESGEIE